MVAVGKAAPTSGDMGVHALRAQESAPGGGGSNALTAVSAAALVAGVVGLGAALVAGRGGGSPAWNIVRNLAAISAVAGAAGLGTSLLIGNRVGDGDGDGPSQGPHTPDASPVASYLPAAVPVPGGEGAVTFPTTVTGIGSESVAGSRGPSFNLREVASGLSQPVFVTHAPGDDALYVVEKTGTIQRIGSDGRKAEFLNLASQVSSGGEQGLLSVAFHPDYERNGKLYVNFTDRAGDTHVTQYEAFGSHADVRSASDLLVIDQPYGNHNGGQLQFGPDGYLYIGMGDGGAGGDPQARSQNPNELLGKMLRIDVDHPSGGKPYGVPADNMFVASGGGKPEIWATGLRNPWRFSFDARAGDMWIGDVGQGAWEEVNYVPRDAGAGLNFGWDVREGANVYENKTAGPGRLVDPALQYTHADGSSITGGYVYRGDDIPSLHGYYVYADIADSTIRAMRIGADGQVADRRTFDIGSQYMVSFGEGPDGELYVASIDGTLRKFVPEGPQELPPGVSLEPDPGSGDAGVVELSTRPGQFRFAQSEIRVKAGEVTLRLTNDDPNMVHNVGISGNGVQAIGPMVSTGQVSEVTANLQPGTYQFECLPHAGLGMVGTLIVEPA